MKEFLIQTGTQLPIIALIWVLISRDASKLRISNGSTPAGISPFAWGALCGITFIGLIPYFILRRKVKTETNSPIRERNLLKLWLVLTVVAIVWSNNELSHHDFNNAAQHFLLAAIFIGCAVYAWYRDRQKI